MNRTITLASTALIALAAAGCARNEAAEAPPAPPQVSVAKVIEKPITEFDEFTGRFTAVDRVELRPRVSGYISSVNFTEGHEVKKGDVLFVIDPRPYDAEYKRAAAELARAKTQLSLAQSEFERARTLLDARAISKEEFDARVSGAAQATANVQAADAALDAAKLNLTFTRVRAPISGLVSKAEVTPGNLVTTDQTLLTTLVSIDPIYVEFEGDEQVYLKYNALARAGLRPSSRDSKNPVWVGLADEQETPHQGVMVFVDNELNPATGTIRARGQFSNKDRRFTPGMFARVKLLGSAEYNALLINDSAIGTDQSVKYVLEVNADNKVEYRAVKLGPVVDGLRVVREGLAPGDSIVVNGLQRVRPGMPVTPQRVAMGAQPSTTGVLAKN
ncbi:MAG TPA: efflux RND transporter periplasmic adaptor subunit [Steroidobacteraceae bacterium]|nr:efflux RND transporter periplasmic adaptor subunit [Steroidobacteraceae bacterium]